ncbi:Arylsulfotransferase-domain-containing protein [Xylariomycetidae sp. FL2044]|nr:Arylsulfotransferase-domain-containing protein [Xylariomycetidae sp. FL2044]
MLALFLLVWSFVSHAALGDKISVDYSAYNNADYGVFPKSEYKSVDIFAPMLQVSAWNKDAMSKTGSHIFLRHDGKTNAKLDSSPLIIDSNDLSVVYLNRSFEAVFDVRVQQNFNESYLTFYGGQMTPDGHGDGYGHAYDSSYREVYTIRAQKLSVKSDLHEFQFTGHGTVLVTAYETVKWDLSPYGGSHAGSILDSIFQEIELETNKVLFTWRSSDFIDMSASFQAMGQRWDPFHLNSMQKTKAGNYLLSARHMHAIYLINGTTGEFIWTLGGKLNEFQEITAEGSQFSNPALTMAWQHHARFYNGNESEITFFDNHVLDYNGYNCKKDCSRGLHIAIDTSGETKTVQILHEYLHPQGLQSQSQGSVQTLDGGNVFVGWGRNPSFTEHTLTGEAVLSVQLSPWRSRATKQEGLDNYRAYKMDWVGKPYWPPDISVEKEGGNGSITAYVSWNGATEVKSWALLASGSSLDLTGADKIVAWLAKDGFETKIPLGSTESRYVRAAALDADHKVIGSTGIVNIDSGVVTKANYSIAELVSDSASLGATTAAEAAEAAAVSGPGDDERASFATEWPYALAFVLLVAVALGALYWRKNAPPPAYEKAATDEESCDDEHRHYELDKYTIK